MSRQTCLSHDCIFKWIYRLWLSIGFSLDINIGFYLEWISKSVIAWVEKRNNVWTIQQWECKSVKNLGSCGSVSWEKLWVICSFSVDCLVQVNKWKCRGFLCQHPGTLAIVLIVRSFSMIVSWRMIVCGKCILFWRDSNSHGEKKSTNITYDSVKIVIV